MSWLVLEPLFLELSAPPRPGPGADLQFGALDHQPIPLKDPAPHLE